MKGSKRLVTVVDPHLKKLQQEIASVVDGLSFEQLSWHPSGKWSAVEILEHLYLTYTGTLKGFNRSISTGTPIVSKETWKNRLQALIVLRFGYLPGGREAPQFARPKGLPPETVISEVGAKIAEMDEELSRYAVRFGANTKILDHVFLGPLSVSQWRKFHLVHGMHHVEQIRRIRTRLGPGKADGAD